jgi:hypothetical protein
VRQPDGRRVRLEPDRRTVPLRRLTPDEVAALGWTGPHQLSRVEVGRFGLWRRTRTLVVETSTGLIRMSGKAEELRVYGLSAEEGATGPASSA